MEDSAGSRLENNYSLSIRFSSDGFSLWVYDESNVLISTKSFSLLLFSLSEDEIVDLIQREIENKLIYSNIRFILESDAYAFVPATLFKPEERDAFIDLQHKLDKTYQSLYNVLADWDMVLVFAVPCTLHAALFRLFPDASVEHHLSVLLTDKIKSRTESCVHIAVRAKVMDVVVVKNGLVLLINSFSYASSEDFVYFTLNVFEQLLLDTESCKVKLYHSEKKPELKSFIQKYVRLVYCE